MNTRFAPHNPWELKYGHAACAMVMIGSNAFDTTVNIPWRDDLGTNAW